jgi:hypothetical protein
MGNTAVKSGWRLLWLRQRILWWLFVVNLALAWLAAGPLTSRWQGILDHSPAADQLYRGFDAARYIELTSMPQIGFGSAAGPSLHSAMLFLLFMLFVTGGILQDYASDHKLSTAEFFQAAGAFFWRFLRLLIMTVIVLVPVGLLGAAVNRLSGRLSSDASPEMLGFWVDVIGFGVVLFLAICVRLWFDLAQVHAVVTGERAMSRAVGRSWRILWRNFPPLFALYIVPSLTAWIGSALIIAIWTRVPGRLPGVTFLLGEVCMLLWLATRLWQRAAEVAWYQRSHAAQPVVTPPLPAVTVPLAPPPNMPV